MYFNRKKYRDECWWCSSQDKSQEHKFKKSEIAREYGTGKYDKYLIHRHNGVSNYIKSSGSNLLKFNSNLCKKCNNERSQSFDNSYDVFQQYIKNNTEQIFRKKEIDFGETFNKDWIDKVSDLLRYYVKNICCAMSDIDVEIPTEIIEFLNGSNLLPYIKFQFGIALDAVEIESIYKEFSDKGYFIRGNISCILNQDTRQCREIKSYLQYRYFRNSYIFDKSIPTVDMSFNNRTITLIDIHNASSFSILK